MIEKWNELGYSPMEAMKKRISVREYKDIPLPEKPREILLQFCEGLSGPFSEKVRIVYLEKEHVGKDIKLGTYGTIKNAPAYLAVIAGEGENAPDQVGYVFEQAVLLATALGLGTCWMAGTYQKGNFAKAAGVKEGEKLYVVSPIGIPFRGERRIQRKRKKFEELFFNGSLSAPMTPKDAMTYGEALEMVRIAPSAINGQPWRLVRNGTEFCFYRRSSTIQKVMMGYEMQRIDLGIALCHFALALEEKGIPGEISLEKPKLQLPKGIHFTASWKPADC